MMNVIITMAGNGRRFREAGYDCPKYEIVAHGRTLFEWSMASLSQFWSSGSRAIFIAQKGHNAKPFIERHAPLCGIQAFDVIEIDGVTDGQATTALAAQAVIANPQWPIAIFNIDTYVSPQVLDPNTIKGHGWIPCFPGKGDGWSFARVASDLQVLELREKVRISEWATVGLYHFASFALYAQLYAQHFAKADGSEKGERYIAPMYNSLLSLHSDVYISCMTLDDVIPLGTPTELDAFKARQPPTVGAPC